MYVGRVEKLLAHYSQIPLCFVNLNGKITRASSKIAEVFKYDGIIGRDIFELTRIKPAELIEAAQNETNLYLDSNDKSFKILSEFIGEGETASIMMSFIDVTSYEVLKDMYNDEKACIAVINVDNFDELTASAGDERELAISTEIDRLIRSWGEKLGAAVVRYREHLYEICLTHGNLQRLVDDKFCILDEAKEIETEADFPVTLSIGVGIGGKTLADCETYAEDALDLALGRGGDQAIIKNIKNFEYYGGKSQSVEKSNKGKSRIIAHALKLLISQSSRIFVMGHRNPDMDSFGASLGIYRIAESMGKEAYVVLGPYNDALTAIADEAKETGYYEFVSPEKALNLVDENSLVVVVDAHRPILVESNALIMKVGRTVVIDHHRRAEDCFSDLLLSYMESYASSASELVTEIIQYACEKRTLTNMEANALLAGIMVDTNRFAVKAGVRTFEAASWLRRAGADLEHVLRYFQANTESFKVRAMCIANAQFFDGGIAMSICPGQNPNSQILNSQVADELLTIRGIRASFVAGQNEYGKTVVSARSLGDVNVQVVMEKFGGGGHLNTAGAQVEMSPEEILIRIREALNEKNS